MKLIISISIILLTHSNCFSQNNILSGKRKLPAFTIDSSTLGQSDFFTVLNNYVKNQIGTIDTTITSNGIEGESWESTKTIRLKGGHIYTNVSYWESGETSIEFVKVSKDEVVELIIRILKQVGLYKQNYDQILREPDRHFIYLYEEECCYIKVEELNHHTILSISN